VCWQAGVVVILCNGVQSPIRDFAILPGEVCVSGAKRKRRKSRKRDSHPRGEGNLYAEENMQRTTEKQGKSHEALSDGRLELSYTAFEGYAGFP
jgi:hypothetical protein